MSTTSKEAAQTTDIPQQAFDWYDEYAHGDIDRRTFISRLSSLAVSGLAISSIAAGLTPNYAKAQQISFNDPDINATYEEFDSPMGHGKGKGYMVVPSSMATQQKATAPCVLVVHENRGLNPYVKDVARRLAKAGFIAFAPDALFPLGGYPGNDDQGRKMQRSMERDKIEQDFIAAAKFLKQHPAGNGKLGVVGFCFGGYISNLLAASLPDLIDAAVPYYGSPARGEIVEQVKGPIMIQLAELDKRINNTWPDYEKQLKANSAEYTMHMYKGVNHGFHNDSTSRFDKPAADLSWQRTLEFFSLHLQLV